MSRDFYNIFVAEKIRPVPHVNRQKRFRELLHFRDDIRKKRFGVVNYYADTPNRLWQLYFNEEPINVYKDEVRTWYSTWGHMVQYMLEYGNLCKYVAAISFAASL